MVLLDSNRIELINKGTSANDGTGDTLREAATKINSNFGKIDSDIADLTLVQLLTKEITEGDAKLDLTILPVQTTGYVVWNNGFDSIGHIATTLDSTDSAGTQVGTFAYIRNLNRFVASDSSTFNRRLLDSDTFSLETFPNFTSAFTDDSNNEILQLASSNNNSVNYLKISNTDSAPVVSAVGDDTNVNLTLSAKGTGDVKVINGFNVGGNASVTGTLTVLDSAVLENVTVQNATFLNNVTINSDLTVTDELRLNGFAVVTPEVLTVTDQAGVEDSATYTLVDANIAKVTHDSDLTINLVGGVGGTLDGYSFTLMVKNSNSSNSISVTIASPTATVSHAIGNPITLASNKFSIIGGIMFDSDNILISNANTV